MLKLQKLQNKFQIKPEITKKINYKILLVLLRRRKEKKLFNFDLTSLKGKFSFKKNNQNNKENKDKKLNYLNLKNYFQRKLVKQM